MTVINPTSNIFLVSLDLHAQGPVNTVLFCSLDSHAQKSVNTVLFCPARRDLGGNLSHND
jgi:hypothetical protein